MTSTRLPSVFSSRMLRKFGVEYFTQPLHVTAAAGLVYLFGGFRSKVTFDLVRRRYHAFALLRAADWAAARGIAAITVVEAGVASGDGLRNMIGIGEKVTKLTGVAFAFVGFDSGEGLPPPVDHRDHPEVWHAGHFPMPDVEALRQSLPAHARLVIGDIADTVPAFVASLRPEAPLGYVVIDVDYYSSAKAALGVLKGAPECYLPTTLVYFDDIGTPRFPWANDWCGERLAIREFNDESPMRKLQHDAFLKYGRIYKDSDWLEKIYTLHVLDHPERQAPRTPRPAQEPAVMS